MDAFPDHQSRATTVEGFGRMGCPGRCRGYELTTSLTFAAAAAWTRIPSFSAILAGNGHTITGINVNVSGGDAGMFGHLGGAAVIRDLGLIDFNVTSTRAGSAGSNGILAGYVPSANVVISNVYVQGGRIAVSTNVGGANVGGLAGIFSGTIRASYSTAAVTMTGSQTGRHAGGLAGRCIGCTITASYAAGPVTSAAALNNIGGLTGSVTNNSSAITDSYCDTESTGQSDCDGNVASGVAASAAGYTTAQLQAPTGYAGIYANWNLDLDGDGNGDNPWDFGSPTDYPTLRILSHDSPPPGGPRYALPPQDTPYDPAADHPEVYVNDRYEMAATCEVQTGADGAAESSRIRFDLGNYQGPVILHLAIWNGEFFMSYESQDLDLPPFQRDGQTATVLVTTNPAQTRFLLDSVSPTTNLVLGYADCHTDDPGAADSDATAESAETSTASTLPPAPKVYVNDRYEMTATCNVQTNADGDPESALITFNLGSYQAPVILHLSRWNGEYYASYESLGIDVPHFQRDGQSATVRVATDPAQTRFLLDSVAPTTNLLLGYADCHTAN